MKFFKDLGDSAKKLLNDDFITDNKIKLTSKTAQGTTYTVSGLSTEKTDDYIGELSVKSKINEHVTVSSKLNTQASLPTYEMKYEDSKLISSYPNQKSITISGNQSKLNVKSDLRTPKLAIALDTDIIKRCSLASITTSITPSNYHSFMVIGTQASFTLTDGSVNVTNSKLSASLFDGSQSEINLSILNPSSPTNIIFNYCHLVRPGFTVAGQIDHSKQQQSSSDSTSSSSTTVLTMASALKLDPVTTIKSKLDTTGKVALAYIQKIRPHTEVVMSSSFDVTKFDTAKVGLAITLD